VSERTRVIDSRPVDDRTAVRRRRECEDCGRRFTTYERFEVATVVHKRDGSTQPYAIAKLRAGIGAAVADRPIAPSAVEGLVERIDAEVGGRAEISSDEIGRMVLEGLRSLDEIAYLRFASVYKEFTGLDDFERELAALDPEATR